MRQIAGDDDGIDRTDRATGDPIRPDPGILQRRVCPSLVGSKRPTTRQHQRNPVEAGQILLGSRARQNPLLPSPTPSCETANRPSSAETTERLPVFAYQLSCK